MTLKFGMQHRVLVYYQVCSNDDPGLTMTYFTARSNLVPYAFVWEKGNSWVTLKPTVGRPDFFMLIGRQTLFWSADWSFHIKNIPHRLPSPTTKFSIWPTVARWSADRRPSAFPCQATCNESADDRPTCGQLSVHQSYDILASVRTYEVGRLIVARCWTDHQKPKNCQQIEKKL